MGRIFNTGFGFQSPVADGYGQVGTGFTYSTTTVRNSGSVSQRVNPSAAGQTYIDFQLASVINDASGFARIYAYFPALPPSKVDVLEMGSSGGAQWFGASLNPSGTVNLETSTAGVLATSVATLATNTWYRFEVSAAVTSAASNDTLEVRIYLGDSTTPLFTLGPSATAWMTAGIKYVDAGSLVITGTMSWDVYLSDFAVNDSAGSNQNSWVGPGRIYTLRPVAAGTAGTAEANWTTTAANKWTPVAASPPTYTTATSNATSLSNSTAASSDVTLACTDYTTAGIGGSDVINVVQPIAVLGSSSTTAKTGTLGMPANPVVSQANVAYPVVVASTTATTWARLGGTMTYAPSVTLGTQPQIRLNRPATSAGTAATNALAILVDVTPGVASAPGAPTSVSALAGTTKAQVSFTAPSSDGGSTITDYTVTASTGQTGTGSASPILVTGLVDGVAVTFTVTATNVIGTGSASSPSASVTPGKQAPGTPTVTPGNAQASVAFTAPTNSYGISEYQVEVT